MPSFQFILDKKKEIFTDVMNPQNGKKAQSKENKMNNLSTKFNGSLGRIIEYIIVATMVSIISMYGNYRILEWKVSDISINLNKTEKVIETLSNAVIINKIENEKQWERLSSFEKKFDYLIKKPRISE